MENIKRCCFAGHGDIWDSGVKERIIKVAKDLIINHNVKEFWVGNYGIFDEYSASAIRELQKTYADVKLELIIPYLTKSINNYKEIYSEKYNNIVIADIPQNTPKRFYIAKTNEYIVNNSDFLICYIQRSWGGAITTYKYAKRKRLQIFNVAEKPME